LRQRLRSRDIRAKGHENRLPDQSACSRRDIAAAALSVAPNVPEMVGDEWVSSNLNRPAAAGGEMNEGYLGSIARQVNMLSPKKARPSVNP
jgi:hypothetical protein